MAGSGLRLIVMRHGEAKPHIGYDDRGRHLTEQGQSQALLAGQRLVALGWQPEEVLVSGAVRTRETYDRVSQAFVGEPKVEFLESFYLATWQYARGQIAECSARTVMILGHNPGWSELVEQLTGSRMALDTAEAALLTLDSSSWSEAAQMTGCWELAHHIDGFGAPT